MTKRAHRTPGDRRFSLFLAFLACLMLAVVPGCGDGTPVGLFADPPSPASITLDPTGFSLFSPGDERTITATVLDDDGRPLSGARVAFTSSDSGVAVVNANGIVQAVGEGRATITAVAGDASASAQVTVDFGGGG
jgi:hypothetical protein